MIGSFTTYATAIDATPSKQQNNATKHLKLEYLLVMCNPFFKTPENLM